VPPAFRFKERRQKAPEADETSSGLFAQVSARTAPKCPQLPNVRVSML
jgi:hypothetical protein